MLKITPLTCDFTLERVTVERVTGIEPALSAWKSVRLPQVRMPSWASG